ncbi:hypothetical protein B0H10DRAFT_2197107, partial [Mycena sp. CBHHK59/15]
MHDTSPDPKPLCAPLLCSPKYYPNRGHEDNSTHLEFYGVLSGHGVGAVSSRASLERALKDQPGATYVQANTWGRLITLWNQNCEEYHNHETESPVSSAPSCPSTLTASETPSLSPAHQTSPTKRTLKAAATVEPIPSAPSTPTKNTRKHVPAWESALTNIFCVLLRSPLSPRLSNTLSYASSMVSARLAHAYHNPAKAVQPSHHRGKSTASKETKALNAAERLWRRINFDVDLDVFYVFRSAEITWIAKAHSKKEDVVHKLLSNATQYKVTRRPNLRNAIIHDRSRKAKADSDYGRIMSDLQGEVADDIEEGDYQLLKATMSAAEKKCLIDQLIEHRELGRQGACATNKAAAMDSMQTANGVRDALLDLFERTGVCSLAMFSRAHPDDTVLPHVVDADESRDFFQQILRVSILDVLRKFEQWCCTQDEETKERNDVASVCKQIVLLVLEGLRRIKKNQMLNMSYINYNIDIRQVLGVELTGWPTKITMDRPNKLSAEDARLIRDGLRSRAIHWVALTKTQKAELDRRRTRGGPLKKRKLRSDAGKKRGPRRNKADGSDDEDENADDDNDEEEKEEEEEEDEQEPAITSKSRNGAPAATTDSSSTSIPTALMSISGE